MCTYLIGIDLGTQGTKTCLYTQEGHLVNSAFEASNLIMPGPGRVEQDPDELYGSVMRTISEVMEKSGIPPESVAAVGMDGQMAGIMGIDRQFQAVTPYDSWLDTQCEGEIARMKAQAGDQVTRITGGPVTYAHGPKILWWKNERPEIYKQIRKFVLPSTYICDRMCGLSADEAYIDHTCLHFSGFADIQALKWSEELLREFDVRPDKLPEIVSPWKIVGHLTPTSAAQCGLKAGTPVCAGAGDQAATSLGAGIVRPGLAFDVAGTASVFSCCTRAYAPDVQHRTLLYARSILPDLWIPLAYINGGGLCVRWIRDILAGTDPNVSYDALAKEAESLPPGSESLLFIPHFSGRVCPNDPDVRGSFLGLTMRHGRAHLYRAVLESIGYEYLQYYRILSQNTALCLDEVYCIGGGAKSRLYTQIKADILNLRYTTLDASDTGSWGAAIVAGHGVGLFPSMAQTAERALTKRETLSPDPERHRAYAHCANLYPKAIPALHALYREL